MLFENHPHSANLHHLTAKILLDIPTSDDTLVNMTIFCPKCFGREFYKVYGVKEDELENDDTSVDFTNYECRDCHNEYTLEDIKQFIESRK